MRAIILVGGRGTRLHPLTNHLPKALLPVAGRSLLEHLLKHLRNFDINEITIASTIENKEIEDRFGNGQAIDMELSYAYESTPMGSGGAIACAAAGWKDPFLAINGDILSDIDISKLRKFHEQHSPLVTLALYKVENATQFGVVNIDQTNKITRFVEKPHELNLFPNWINAGIWIIEPEILSLIKSKIFTRIESDLFPELARNSDQIFGFRHHGRWTDIGTPATYHQANMVMLETLCHGYGNETFLPGNKKLTKHRWNPCSVIVDKTSIIHSNVRIHGPVSIGRNCEIQTGAIVRESVIWDDVKIKSDAVIDRTILGSRSHIETGSHLYTAIIAPDSSIEKNNHVNQGF